MAKTTAKAVLSNIVSSAEYMLDRGEMEGIDEFDPAIRYTDTQVDRVEVRVGKQRFELSIKEI